MKRSDFLKKIGLCVIVAPILPIALAETPAKEEELNRNILKYPLTTRDCYKYCLGNIFNFNGGEYMITSVPYFPGETDYILTPLNTRINNGQSIFVGQGALDDAFIRVR